MPDTVILSAPSAPKMAPNIFALYSLYPASKVKRGVPLVWGTQGLLIIMPQRGYSSFTRWREQKTRAQVISPNSIGMEIGCYGLLLVVGETITSQ